jgi:hypothetical protein
MKLKLTHCGYWELPNSSPFCIEWASPTGPSLFHGMAVFWPWSPPKRLRTVHISWVYVMCDEWLLNCTHKTRSLTIISLYQGAKDGWEWNAAFISRIVLVLMIWCLRAYKSCHRSCFGRLTENDTTTQVWWEDAFGDFRDQLHLCRNGGSAFVLSFKVGEYQLDPRGSKPRAKLMYSTPGLKNTATSSSLMHSD